MRLLCSAAVLALLVPGIAYAAANCADWNTIVFFEAATARDVQACLDAGADLEARDSMGLTPLHNAVGHTLESVTVLLDAGADIGARSEVGLTPLHLTAALGTPPVINALLNAGADIQARDKFGNAPLHMAAALGTPEVVTALLDAGASAAPQTGEGETPFDLVARERNADMIGTKAYWRLNDARFR